MFQFKKSEHIVSTSLIETLFGGGGIHIGGYPVRALAHKVPRCRTGVPVQVLVSVPKKRLKHAVDRNRAKRQIREAYRHAKLPLTEAVPSEECLLLAFFWSADRSMPSAKVTACVEKLLNQIVEKC